MSTVLVPFLSFNGRVYFKINCSLIVDVNYMCQANAIISKLQTTTNQQRGDEPTVLIAADTVCCVSPS